MRLQSFGHAAAKSMWGAVAVLCVAPQIVLAPAPSLAAEPAKIAVAASLRIAIEEVAKEFEATSGNKIVASFGATGNLVRQIETGAPFELFLAADEASVNKLAAAGLTDGAGDVLVEGDLAFVAPKASKVAVDAELKGLSAALKDGTLTRLAIANPELAPYGKAAKQALAKAGLLAEAEPKLVLGENIAQAAQYVATGNADAAFIAQSLAVAPEFAGKINAVVVPKSLHDPIRQKMAILKSAGQTARDFYAFLKSGKASAIFAKYGFSKP